MYPLTAIVVYFRLVIGWWAKRVGAKGVLGMLAGGTVLAVILNYTT